VNDTIELIKQRLVSLQPESIDIVDDSAKHAGHAGAASGGGHYQLTIVSQRFAGKTQVARHRLIYQTLGDLMQRQIHALSIAAYTPDQL
jgi:BolA family transcriptional regulator, general stress-responsive regulator